MFIYVLIIIAIIVTVYYLSKEKYSDVESGTTLPETLNNGEVVYCSETGNIYKIENNLKRYYSLDVYINHGRPTLKVLSRNQCQLLNSVIDGNPMQ